MYYVGVLILIFIYFNLFRFVLYPGYCYLEEISSREKLTFVSPHLTKLNKVNSARQ